MFLISKLGKRKKKMSSDWLEKIFSKSCFPSIASQYTLLLLVQMIVINRSNIRNELLINHCLAVCSFSYKTSFTLWVDLKMMLLLLVTIAPVRHICLIQICHALNYIHTSASESVFSLLQYEHYHLNFLLSFVSEQ